MEGLFAILEASDYIYMCYRAYDMKTVHECALDNFLEILSDARLLS